MILHLDSVYFRGRAAFENGVIAYRGGVSFPLGFVFVICGERWIVHSVDHSDYVPGVINLGVHLDPV